MKESIHFAGWIVLLLGAVAADSRSSQSDSGAMAFSGRWQINMETIQARQFPFAIVEIDAGGVVPSAKIVATLPTNGWSITIGDISILNGQIALTFHIEDPHLLMYQFQVGKTARFRGKRVGDHLEGTVDTGAVNAWWYAYITTLEKLVPWIARKDEEAFRSACDRPAAERAEALKQVLKDYPAAHMKEQIHFEIAKSVQDPGQRAAALRRFLGEYPNGSCRDEANLEMALAHKDPVKRESEIRKFLEAFPTSYVREEACFQLISAIRNPREKTTAMEKFVRDFPGGVHQRTVFLQLLDARLQQKPLDESKIREFCLDFLKTRPDIVRPFGQYEWNYLSVDISEIARVLCENGALLDWALELAGKAAEILPPKSTAYDRVRYLTALGNVYYARKEYDQAEREYREALDAAGPSGNKNTIWNLGKALEARNDIDAALDAYMKAALLGPTPEIQASLEGAYHKKHGRLNGLEEKLDAMYRALPRRFDAGKYSRGDKGLDRRAVLAELFTGVECPICAAADLAFDGLANRYDRNTVVLLVYHLHKSGPRPGPDPFTNPDTLARSYYYDVSATPKVLIDGLDAQTSGAMASQAARVFNNYVSAVESRLDSLPRASLSRLTATPNGKAITVAGQVDISPDVGDRLGSLKIRIALVEEEISHSGGNGIRLHGFVVRKMLGSPGGIPIRKLGTGNLFSESVNLGKLSAGLRAYLKRYEKERPDFPGSAFSYREKYALINPAKLGIVVFVQNDKTKEILQAGYIKVEIGLRPAPDIP